MQTPSIRLIPAEYLERVKGNVSTRQDLAREANLPKVVLDRLVCDRAKSVREYAAKNPGLDAEQVLHLLDDCDYHVIYELNRNHKLSHELVVLQVRHRYGVRDNCIFKNPNIKASEFVGLVEEYLTESGASNWSRRSVYQTAVVNKGVGNGAVIALTESAFKDSPHAYSEIMQYALRNESLSARSIQYLIDRAKRRLDGSSEALTMVKVAIGHPNASNEFIDSVVLDSLASGENVLRVFDFSEGYEASEAVIEKVTEAYPNHDNERHMSFLVNHVPKERLTPERIAKIEFTHEPSTAASLILKGVELSEESIDRLVMIVASSGDNENIELLAENLYIKSHHIDEMASSSSWSVRRKAARMYNISEETLKTLATDSDSDVRQAVRENPKWKLIKDSVEYNEKANTFASHSQVIHNKSVELLERNPIVHEFAKDYPDVRPFIEAMAVMADPKFKAMLKAFTVEESRNLMKDGIDLDTLTLLEDFF